MAEITKRKKSKKPPKNYPTPGHAAAEGSVESPGHLRTEQGEVMVPDTAKHAPVYDAPSCQLTTRADRMNEIRTSEPLSQGHASHSSGDHGHGSGRNSQVAVNHKDLRQSNTDFSGILANLKTNPYNFIGGAAFHGVFSTTDSPAGSPGNTATVHSLDAAGEAGSYRGMNSYSDTPEVRTEYRNVPTGSGTNGGHSSSSQYGAQTTPRQSMKGNSPLDIMKAHLRGELE